MHPHKKYFSLQHTLLILKIGIMTFWWSEANYGQLLQCFALQKRLRDLGHEAFLIKYHQKNGILESSLRKKFNTTSGSHEAPQKIPNIHKPDRQFELFRQKYIAQSHFSYTSLQQLQDNPPDADIYIVGSDQVWNFWNVPVSVCKNFIHTYFLDFGDENTQRISYAASWGRTDISDEEIAEITPLLKRFGYISVREESGVKLCKKCGRQDAKWIDDPTFLLSPQTYRNIYNDNIVRRMAKKFLLLYMLNNACDCDTQSVYDFAAKKNLEVVYVTGNSLVDNRKKFYATIPEWLYLIDNAEYVVTNSFHGGAFSIIFHKKFGIAPLVGTAAGMNVRFMSMFERKGTGNRFVTSDKLDVLEQEYTTKETQQDEQFWKIFK